jgi:hypothetical protein
VAPVAEDHAAQNKQRPGGAEDLGRRIDGAFRQAVPCTLRLDPPIVRLESLGSFAIKGLRTTSTSGDDMSLVRVHNFSVSLDGFGTGEGQQLDAPFGHAGSRLMKWAFETRTFREMGIHGESEGSFGVDEAFASTWRPGITTPGTRLRWSNQIPLARHQMGGRRRLV